MAAITEQTSYKNYICTKKLFAPRNEPAVVKHKERLKIQ